MQTCSPFSCSIRKEKSSNSIKYLDVTPQIDAAVMRKHDDGVCVTEGVRLCELPPGSSALAAHYSLCVTLKHFQATQTSQKASLPSAKYNND